MEATDTRSSFRSRIVQNALERAQSDPAASSTIVDDPFAGDDALWAPEDWMAEPWTVEPWTAQAWANAARGEADSLERFFAGLVYGLVFSALVWLGLLVTALTLLDLIA